MAAQFQTVKEVANLLKVGEPTVRRWIKNMELRAIDVGRGWRIAPEDLDRFLQQHANFPQHSVLGENEPKNDNSEDGEEAD